MEFCGKGPMSMEGCLIINYTTPTSAIIIESRALLNAQLHRTKIRQKREMP